MKVVRVATVLWVTALTAGCAVDEAGQGPESSPPANVDLSERFFFTRRGERDDRPAPAAELTESSTLHDLLAHAAEHSPRLDAAFHRWKAAEEMETQAGTLPDPRFTYRYYLERVETRTGAQRQSFGVEQQFPWFGTLGHRSRAASHAARAAQNRYEATFLRVIHQVRSAWYESYYLERSIEIARTNLELLKQFENVVRTRYRAARESQEALLRLQVELGTLDDRLRSMEDRRATVRARLNAALGRAADAAVPAARTLPEERIADSDAQIVDWARENSPALKALAQEIAAEQERIGEAEKQQYPDVMVGLTVIDTADQPGAGPHPREDGDDPVIAGISVNLPIWTDRYSAAVRQAGARRRAARSARAQYAVELEADVREAMVAARSAWRRVELYSGSLIPRARQSLKASEAAFRTGSVSFADLIDAQRTLLDLQLEHERARVDHAERLSELEMLVGRPVSVADDENARPTTMPTEQPGAPLAEPQRDERTSPP